MRYAPVMAAVFSASFLLAPAIAPAGEKVQGNMVNPFPAGYWRDLCNGGAVPVPPSPDFVPGVSQAKFKFTDTCKGIIVLKKLLALPLSDGIPGTGDEVYCLVNFYDSFAVCGSFIVRGEITGALGVEKVKIKINGPAELPGVCPAAPGTNWHITSVECYNPDFAFSSPLACLGAGGLYTPFVSDVTQGLCHPAGAYVPNSPSPALAVQGVTY